MAPSKDSSASPQSWHIALGPGADGSFTNVKKKKRIRNVSAGDREAHRVFEKGRREAFKERLTALASLVPSLQTTEPSKLSKHVVLDESASFHRAQKQEIDESAEKIKRLKTEREEILSELNLWRSSAGLETRRPGYVAVHTGTDVAYDNLSVLTSIEKGDWTDLFNIYYRGMHTPFHGEPPSVSPIVNPSVRDLIRQETSNTAAHGPGLDLQPTPIYTSSLSPSTNSLDLADDIDFATEFAEKLLKGEGDISPANPYDLQKADHEMEWCQPLSKRMQSRSGAFPDDSFMHWAM